MLSLGTLAGSYWPMCILLVEKSNRPCHNCTTLEQMLLTHLDLVQESHTTEE